MEKWISYAQNFEDVLLKRLFPEGGDGFYIDVGANHPVFHSVTKHFYDRGWRGINVEPMPGVIDELCAQRQRDVNLGVGLSNREGHLTFYGAPSIPQLTTNPDVMTAWFGAERSDLVEHTVPVTTLSRICDQYVGDRTIDFLKVDVEGHELAVLEGGDWARWRPRALVIEGSREPWEHLLLEADYLFATFDGVNQYYLRAEDRDLIPRLQCPVYVLDNFVQYEQIAPYEPLEKALEATQAALEEARARCEVMRARLASVEGLGPSAVAVARRLHRMSRWLGLR